MGPQVSIPTKVAFKQFGQHASGCCRIDEKHAAARGVAIPCRQRAATPRLVQSVAIFTQNKRVGKTKEQICLTTASLDSHSFPTFYFQHMGKNHHSCGPRRKKFVFPTEICHPRCNYNYSWALAKVSIAQFKSITRKLLSASSNQPRAHISARRPKGKQKRPCLR